MEIPYQMSEAHPMFTPAQLPPGAVLMVVKNADGKEYACGVSMDSSPQVIAACFKNLVAVGMPGAGEGYCHMLADLPDNDEFRVSVYS